MQYRVERACGFGLLIMMLAVAVAGCAWLSAERAAAAGVSAPSQKIDALYLEARLEMAEGDNQTAAARLDEALRISGCPPEVYVARAEIYARSENGRKPARALLDKGLRAYPDHPDLLIAKAQIAEQDGRIDDAIGLLEQALKAQPDRRSVLERLSQLHLKRFRQISSADQLKDEINALVDIYQRILANSRGVERIGPLLVLSSLYLRIDRQEEALELAKEAVAIRPRDPRTLLALGSVNQVLKRRDDALAAYRKALLINPELEDANKSVGELLGGDKNRLIDFYRGMAEELPHSAAMQLQYAQVLIDAHRWADAEKPLRGVLKDNPGVTPASIGLMAVLQAQKKTPQALEVGIAALHEDPRNQEVLGSVGELLRGLPDKTARAKWYRKLTAEFEPYKEVQTLVARELVRDENWPEADKQLETIIRKWPGDAPTRLARVRAWLGLGRYEEAMAEARKLAAEKSDMTTVVTLAIAENMHNRKKTGEAIRFVEEIRRVRPDDEGLTVWYGWLLLSLKRNQDAFAMLEKFRAAHPDSYDVTALLVEAYADEGKYQQALALVDGLPKSVADQKSNEILLLKATLSRRQHKLDTALKLMQELIGRDTKNAGYHQELGMIFQEMGRNSDAEKAYKRAIELDPNDPESYNTLGYFYAETGQKLDEALNLVTRALDLKPDAGHILDSLGWVYYQRGDYKKAVDMLQRAAKIMADKPDPVILDHLGDAQAKTGNAELARDAWRKALELKPDKPELIQRKLEGAQ
ncbi:MAG: tetratricopeptide repeat protein [Candidatus Sumerlaeia bacterium]